MYFKPATVIHLGIILFGGQVIHIPYRKVYTCHALDPLVIIPEGGLVFPTKFMTPMRKTSYWYYYPDEAISVMVTSKQVVMP